MDSKIDEVTSYLLYSNRTDYSLPEFITDWLTFNQYLKDLLIFLENESDYWLRKAPL